jgi:hypothetical protein
LHCPGATSTDNQWSPTSSNTIVDANAVPPFIFDAVATHPPELHTERTAYVPIEGAVPGVVAPSSPVAGPNSAIDQPHRHVEPTVDLPDVIDRHHVGIVEACGGAGFAAEPLVELRVLSEVR